MSWSGRAKAVRSSIRSPRHPLGSWPVGRSAHPEAAVQGPGRSVGRVTPGRSVGRTPRHPPKSSRKVTRQDRTSTYRAKKRLHRSELLKKTRKKSRIAQNFCRAYGAAGRSVGDCGPARGSPAGSVGRGPPSRKRGFLGGRVGRWVTHRPN